MLGLDALASIGYGPEAALIILLSLGAGAYQYYPVILGAIVASLFMLHLSYQQTAGAYPNGGGAYIVAKENLGRHAALWAAVALILDYLLNVAVGIAAGVGAIVSAIPALHPHLLALCLVVLLMLTLLNLHGIRESGLTFAVPGFLFVGCVGVALVLGLFRVWQAGGYPHALVAPPPVPMRAAGVSTWLLLTAFANGCTAMTGVAAVSNMERDNGNGLRKVWREKVEEPARAARRPVPKLHFIDSPYRWLYQPIVDFVKTAEQEKSGRVLAVIIPELVDRHWYTYLLHPRRGERLRKSIYAAGDERTIVIDTPWFTR